MTKRRCTTALATIAAAGVLVAAGCGSDTNSPGPAGGQDTTTGETTTSETSTTETSTTETNDDTGTTETHTETTEG